MNFSERVIARDIRQIISGCDWGNILVWAEGLIKIEVSRKNKKTCHSSYISQFEYVDEELITVGK